MNRIKKSSITLTGLLIFMVVVAVFTSRSGRTTGNPIQPALESLGAFEDAMRVYTPLCENIVFHVIGPPSHGALIQILVYGREN
jgi:hypothetical protein